MVEKRCIKMNTKREIYDTLSKILTEYETEYEVEVPNRKWEREFYDLLVIIQRRWEDTITADEEYEEPILYIVCGKCKTRMSEDKADYLGTEESAEHHTLIIHKCPKCENLIKTARYTT